MSSQHVGVGLENLFDNVSAAELTAGDIEYRCYYVRNNDGTDTLTGATIYFYMDTPSPDTVFDMGKDPAGIGNGITTGVATTVINESTAPAGVTFSHPIDQLSGIALGNLTPGNGHAVWLRRTVTAGGTAAAWDAVKIRVEGGR